MNGSLKVYKALLWKQSRESLWIFVPAFLATVFLTLGPIYSFHPRKDDSLALLHLFQSYYIVCGFLGLVLAFFFFIPLYAAESERKTLTFLATKPIPSEQFASFSALFSGIMATFLLVFSNILFFAVTYYLFPNPERYSNLTYIPTYFYNICLGLLFLYGFGSFFLLASAIASSRIRSLGIAIVALLVWITGLIVNSEFAEEVHDYPALTHLLRQIYYAAAISPIALILAGCALFIPLAFAAFRLRMKRSLYFWKQYAVVETVLLILFLMLFAAVLPNRNLTQINLSPNSLGPETQRYSHYLHGKLYKERSEFKDRTQVRGEYIVSCEGEKRFTPRDETAFPVHLMVRRIDGEQPPRSEFHRSMQTCFDIETPSDANIHPEDKVFYRRDDWGMMLAENSGIILGKIDPKLSTIGYDKNGVPIQKSLSAFDRVLLGHIALNDSIQFTPVKRCVFHYVGLNGKESATVECIQPGVFDKTDLTSISRPLIQESKRRRDMRTPGTLEDYSQDVNIVGSGFTISRLTGWFDDSTNRDHFEGNRLFRLDYESDRNGKFWPIVSCYDFSDPETITVYCGTAYQDEYPLSYMNPYTFGAYPIAKLFAVDGDRLIHAITNFDSDTLVAFDISDPNNIHEIQRRTYSKWFRWGNWPIAPPYWTNSNMHLEQGKYLIHYPLGAYLYELGDDLSLQRIARRTQYDRMEGIDDARLTDGRLSVSCNYQLYQYDIGKNVSSDQENSGSPFLMIQGNRLYKPTADDIAR